MDQIKTGRMIAALRKEKKMTQAQLGEKLGVTNKTVSRWENGNYMPDIEMLSLLAEEFGVSINELIVGERLAAEEFRKAADTNLVAALNDSAFTLKEKIRYFRKKWCREHVWSMIVCAVLWIALIVALRLQNVEGYLIGAAGGLVAVLFYLVLYNRRMAYVEKKSFPADPAHAEKRDDR